MTFDREPAGPAAPIPTRQLWGTQPDEQAGGPQGARPGAQAEAQAGSDVDREPSGVSYDEDGATESSRWDSLLQTINDTFEEFHGRLSKIEQIAAELTEAGPRLLDPEHVAPWVDKLIVDYGLENRVPENWDKIPGVVQELTALCSAWRAAYDPKTGQAKSGLAAVQWHDALARTIARIDDWNTKHTTRQNRAG